MPGSLDAILGLMDRDQLSTDDKKCYDQIAAADQQISNYFSQYEIWDQNKAAWEGERETYGKALNEIELRWYQASIPGNSLFGQHNVTRQNEEGVLNNQYPDRVTQFTSFPDSPPVFFMNTQFDCLACQNQVTTGEMVDSMLEISQTAHCLINRVKGAEAEDLEDLADQAAQEGRHDEAAELRRRAAEAKTLSEAAAVEADRIKYLLRSNPGWIVLGTMVILLLLIFLAAAVVFFMF